jgi:predicted transcriptional regulator
MDGAPRPTGAELEILSVLWDRGPSTVREVHETLEGAGNRPSSRRYTTVLKLLQRMDGKGLVSRDERGRAHVYQAVVSSESTRARMVAELADKVFGGSTLRLAVQALSSRPADPEDIEKVREMLRRLEDDRE